jgi:hypothetical protein
VDKGITLDGFRAIKYSARIIVEVELRHTTIEIGLVKMWLVVDDEVEITDGQNIVVIRKRISGYVHHALSVDLGKRH